MRFVKSEAIAYLSKSTGAEELAKTIKANGRTRPVVLAIRNVDFSRNKPLGCPQTKAKWAVKQSVIAIKFPRLLCCCYLLTNSFP